MPKKSYAVLALAAIVLTACSAKTAGPSQNPTDTSSNTQSASPTETQCWLSPITGQCSSETAPVMIVKIDDVKAARPQRSLNTADLILVEPVEGGLTRLMAVYQSQDPIIVGPVRSARITDTDITPAFGVPGFAYSGARTSLKPILQKAVMQRVGAPEGGTGYFRDHSRPAPHNYMATFADLVSRIKSLPKAQLVTTEHWLTADTPTAGEAINSLKVRWPASEKTFIWDPAKKQWKIKVFDSPLQSMTPTDTLERATTDNVFVMDTVLQASQFGDASGGGTPFPKTTGSGTGWVLTNGQRIKATWKRPLVTGLPRWFAADGSEIAVVPGRSWILITDSRDDVSWVLPSTASASASATPSASKS